MPREPKTKITTAIRHWRNTQYELNWDNAMVVDLFCGGGGASTGLEMGLRRPVDLCINQGEPQNSEKIVR